MASPTLAVEAAARATPPPAGHHWGAAPAHKSQDDVVMHILVVVPGYTQPRTVPITRKHFTLKGPNTWLSVTRYLHRHTESHKKPGGHKVDHSTPSTARCHTRSTMSPSPPSDHPSPASHTEHSQSPSGMARRPAQRKWHERGQPAVASTHSGVTPRPSPLLQLANTMSSTNARTIAAEEVAAVATLGAEVPVSVRHPYPPRTLLHGAKASSPSSCECTSVH